MAELTKFPAINRMLARLVKEEFRAQGHYLTGALEESIMVATTKEDASYLFTVRAAAYAKFVNEGIPPNLISWKMMPGLIRYFKRRGFTDNPEYFAANTIRKWMREGMPTQDSQRFSSTGSRQHAIEQAFERRDREVNKIIESSLEYEIDINYRRVKSERI